jgi:DNA-binding CsgD family transcriptional regulator
LEGLKESEAARRLELSEHTVHTHIKAIYRFFGVHSKAELQAQLMQTRSFDGQPTDPRAGMGSSLR